MCLDPKQIGGLYESLLSKLFHLSPSQFHMPSFDSFVKFDDKQLVKPVVGLKFWKILWLSFFDLPCGLDNCQDAFEYVLKFHVATGLMNY